MSKLIDLTGKRFGRLVVERRITEISPKERNYRTLWQCRCDCGKTVIVWANNLVRGDTRSCGCYKSDLTSAREREHGMSDTRLYEIWKGMRRRCCDPKRNSYNNYGARGIFVCDEWDKSFNSFKDWALSSGYKDGMTIDREDNNGPYCPENCKWATMKEQANNRRTSRFIDVFGQHLTISQASEIFGIKSGTIRARLESGWSAEKAVSVHPKHHTCTLDEIIGGAE